MSYPQKQKEAREPDFKGKIDVAVWKNIIQTGDNKGDTYLTIKIGSMAINVFKNIPKLKVSEERVRGEDF